MGYFIGIDGGIGGNYQFSFLVQSELQTLGERTRDAIAQSNRSMTDFHWNIAVEIVQPDADFLSAEVVREHAFLRDVLEYPYLLVIVYWHIAPGRNPLAHVLQSSFLYFKIRFIGSAAIGPRRCRGTGSSLRPGGCSSSTDHPGNGGLQIFIPELPVVDARTFMVDVLHTAFFQKIPERPVGLNEKILGAAGKKNLGKLLAGRKLLAD